MFQCCTFCQCFQCWYCCHWCNDYNPDNQYWQPTQVMPKVCQWYMPKICPRYAPDMPKICPTYAQGMSKICQRYARDMPKECPRNSQDMPKVCPRYVQGMPKICPRYAQDMSKICNPNENFDNRSVLSIYLQDSRPQIKQVMLIPGQSNFHISERFWMAVVSRQQEAAHLARPEDIVNQIF